MAPRVIVLGWDSATFDVIDPLVAEGRLPTIAAMQQEGTRAPLRSTWPPMTDSAWTSAFTGRNPGAHGIFGSWYRAPGEYACRYFSSRDRRVPTLWEMAGGSRFLVWNVPMSFPPTSVEGVMVAGYGAPPGSRFCDPPAIQEELAHRWPLGDLLDRAPHGSLNDFLLDLLRGLDAQSEALIWLTERAEADCVAAVWPQIDRAQHFFWRFRGSDHPLAEAVERVYEACDRATGRIVEAFPDADVMVVSDHGAGPLLGDVNVGAFLAQRGDAVYTNRSSAGLAGLAWSLPPAVRRFGKRIAPSLARRTVAASLTDQLGSFDWTRTRAFMGVHSDLWLNLAGREPQGMVTEDRADETLDELAESLLGIVDPRTGAPVFEAAYRRAEIYSGPAVDRAPDLMLDPWSRGYRVAPGRGPSEQIVSQPVALSGVDAAWSADHRPLGIFMARGPRIRRGVIDELALLDVCPTALALLDRDIPEGLDGRPATAAIAEPWLQAHPLRQAEAAQERAAGGDYSDEEAAAVAEHLKDLGYIE